MATRSWEGLSIDYRGRLARGGITKTDYESGMKLIKARGHGKTPERPERADLHPERYPEYNAKRQVLARQVLEKKIDTLPVRNQERARKYIEKNPVTERPPSMAYMRAYLRDDFDIDSIDWNDHEWAFLYYH